MMKYLILILTLSLTLSSIAQPPNKKLGQNKGSINGPDDSYFINDTLKVSYDTSKYMFKVWMNGVGPESYLARVPGYMVMKVKKGKYMEDQPLPFFYNAKWEAIKPQDIEPNLSIKQNW